MPGERQQVFLRAAGILERRGGEVLGALAAETGCGRHLGEIQLDFAIKLLRQAAHLAYQPAPQNASCCSSAARTR
ncbi:hypothetical protein [Nonomuraea rubra]|uniref:hypothetical protein n=1 Tax=Nonomuraea rubra TaxID=46180 RepID=UPI00331BFD78